MAQFLYKITETYTLKLWFSDKQHLNHYLYKPLHETDLQKLPAEPNLLHRNANTKRESVTQTLSHLRDKIMNPVDTAIAQAAEAAKNLEAQAQQVIPAQTSTAVSTSVGSFDDDDDTPSGLVVDRWIRVCPDGILFDKTHTAKQAVDKPFRVAINTQREVGYRNMFSIAWGNPTKYAKTYNNPKKGAAFDTEGRPWTQVIAQAKAEDPKAYDYQTAEVAMTLLADTCGVTAGKVLATSFSFSQSKNWFSFLDEVAKAGLKGQVVEVELGHFKENKGNYKPWGVYTFKLIGAYNPA